MEVDSDNASAFFVYSYKYIKKMKVKSVGMLFHTGLVASLVGWLVSFRWYVRVSAKFARNRTDVCVCVCVVQGIAGLFSAVGVSTVDWNGILQVVASRH